MKFPKEFDNGIIVEDIKSPRWANREHTRLSCVATFSPGQVVPFGASLTDPEPHGRAIYDHILAGLAGKIAEYERPAVTKEDLQAELDKILPDVMLGLATPEEIELARNLRIQIKAME
ncbi:hypothetical protein Andromeda_40 [Pseudomonas phage Andromeda]|uniref:Uncharacterized protein n=1 Tax=Pseudomonas phage Andromeda TaxID=1873949 RepID=A0A1B1SEN9_9CAUD|nr:tail fiber protein [Pseudomonas phage Andromeda]ANU79115.1 hypothetical protein Andromeda_40 [Pseudomonas phage Andromeda]